MVPGLPEGLHHRDGGVWLKLPDWAAYFASVGSLASTSAGASRKVAVGLVVPTRAYCAAFTALGVLTSTLGEGPTSDGSLVHYQTIARLPIGTPLWLRRKNRKVYAEFDGLDESRGGPPRLRIKVAPNEKGGLTNILSPADSNLIEIRTGGATNLPGKQKGREIVRNDRFVGQFFDGKDIYSALLQSRLWCVLIGNADRLHGELASTELAIVPSEPGDSKNLLREIRRVGSQVPKGCLQELLRPRAIAGVTSSYLCDVVSKAARDETPKVAIFDGARAFLRWRDNLRESNWIVVLDRTEPEFAAAADVLNQRYLRRLASGFVTAALDRLPPAPPSVELLVFEEER